MDVMVVQYAVCVAATLVALAADLAMESLITSPLIVAQPQWRLKLVGMFRPAVYVAACAGAVMFSWGFMYFDRLFIALGLAMAVGNILVFADRIPRAGALLRRHKMVALARQDTAYIASHDSLMRLVLNYAAQRKGRQVVVEADWNFGRHTVTVDGTKFRLAGDPELSTFMFWLASSGRYPAGASLPLRITLENQDSPGLLVTTHMGLPFYRTVTASTDS